MKLAYEPKAFVQLVFSGLLRTGDLSVILAFVS